MCVSLQGLNSCVYFVEEKKIGPGNRKQGERVDKEATGTEKL